MKTIEDHIKEIEIQNEKLCGIADGISDYDSDTTEEIDQISSNITNEIKSIKLILDKMRNIALGIE